MSCFSRITGLLLLLVWFTGHPVVAQSWDWASTAGGSSSDKGLDMDIDADGNLYVCGYYNFQANFDTITTPSAFGKEGFIAKIDPSGAWQWVRTANGGWDERVLGICVDKVNGYVYATGTTWNNINTFGSCAPAPFQGSADNIFVGKFDLDGNCIWTVLAGGGADDHGYDLITDQQGNIYLTGFISDEYFQNTTAVFGSISVSILLGDSICFVAKMSPDGTFLWVKTFDGTDGERDNRIAIDSDANVYITGGFWGTKPFGDTTVTSEGGNDIFVIKFDKDGNQQWVRTVGSTLGDRGNSITVDQFDNIYVTGEFRDTLRFGTDDLNNYGSPGGRDIFVARITPDGEWLWATKAGSNGGQEKGTYITSNDNENIFVTGQFKRTAKFGSITITSVGDTLQAFVGAISTTGVWHWVLQGGGTFADRGSGIAVDESCNVYVAGYYVLNADFAGYSLTGLGLKDVFVAKVKDGCFEFGPPPPPPPEFVDTVIIPPSSPQGELFIPNAFSPNGDGNNDVLKVYGGGIAQMKFEIYNRWGEKVFETSTQKEGWDGTQKGMLLNSGVFAYKLNVIKSDGSTITKNGNITLIR